MDIAAMSVVMNNNQVRMDASMKMLNHTKQLSEQMGEQLIEMLEDSMPVHPTLGKTVDVSA